MSRHVENRLKVLAALREELFGPVSALQVEILKDAQFQEKKGIEIDCSGPISFDKKEDSYGPFYQAEGEEEILLRDPPCKRYGVGVLYPSTNRLADVSKEAEFDDAQVSFEEATEHSVQSSLDGISGGIRDAYDDGDDEIDISGANEYRQSCIGLSFQAHLPSNCKITVRLTGGRYIPKTVLVAGRSHKWWLRRPIEEEFSFSSSEVVARSRKLTKKEMLVSGAPFPLKLEVQFLSRYLETENCHLITVCLINRTQSVGFVSHDSCLFQTFLAVEIAGSAESRILPYRESTVRDDLDDQAIRLLYGSKPAFAIGHGCAAGWNAPPGSRVATTVYADCLPTCEVYGVTPEVKGRDGKLLTIPMGRLAGLDPSNDGASDLKSIVAEYAAWIDLQASKLPSIDEALLPIAQKHVEECKKCVKRMEDGLQRLKDPLVAQAFRLANHAILLQQQQSRLPLRNATHDEHAETVSFSPAYFEPSLSSNYPGEWRAFQIAFFLMNLDSTVTPSSSYRDTVELIWFPTGGGKTEAYLGLSAFTIFARRLKNPLDAGVEVLMRYTLRLLTAQQFQRAASLVCAMEAIRSENPHLGPAPFTIGIWVGGDSTPNSRKVAKEALAKMREDSRAENPFLLLKCPWCGARMGPLERKTSDKQWPQKRARGRGRRSRTENTIVLGYLDSNGGVELACHDRMCRFTRSLPVKVIDEDLYESPPTIVIGTVDKFATLAWRPEARSLFGLDHLGNRRTSPPGLIIQDELHLIAGPLGSMVGLFEAVVEELCTDRRGEVVRPKIIASTATIRRYQEQIRSLYGRPTTQLFPPPGLDSADSFFAVEDSESPGRIYVGVNAPGLGSMQTTQVRTFTALIQSAQPFSAEDRDPWWTLLVFFNSLRELGTTVSLFQSDIPDYFTTYWSRTGKDSRRVYEINELTGRLRRDQVPKAIEELEVTSFDSRKKPVDVCLASNIIEVGVDIPRLSLMAIVGQPKTTSQYIQVSGRVGRRSKERPGLVVTLYSASKPRDRSHYERFRSYHERLYAEVEPTSVTPFSYPCLERALHAAMVSYVRQTESFGLPPSPVPLNRLEQLRKLLVERVALVNPSESTTLESFFARRLHEWVSWERTKWKRAQSEEEPGLLRIAGQYAPTDHLRLSWATPQSMRNVDAECQVEITTLYLNEQGE